MNILIFKITIEDSLAKY